MQNRILKNRNTFFFIQVKKTKKKQNTLDQTCHNNVIDLQPVPPFFLKCQRSLNPLLMGVDFSNSIGTQSTEDEAQSTYKTVRSVEKWLTVQTV